MAYLSNTDDQEQQKQSQGTGFDAFNGGQQAQDRSQGPSQAINSWIGGGRSAPKSGAIKSNAATDSSATAADSAKGYQSTFAGDGNVDAKAQAQPDSPTPMQQGLTGSGQGTGFINFQNYENNAPSQAGAISNAGSAVIGGENANLSKAEASLQSAGSGQTVGRGVGRLHPSLDKWIGMSPDQVAAAVAGDLSSGNTSDIQAGLTPNLKKTTIDYTQGDDYTKSSPELTETPIVGGQTKPSVLDYLAKDQIAAGGYTAGDRMLDSALIAGDAKAQQAIQGNQALDKKYQDRLTTEVPGLIKANTDYNTQATTAKGSVDAGITAAGNKLQGDIAAATDAYNKKPSPETLANEQTAIKAYQDWYTTGGQNGGTWSQSGGGGGAATAVVTPAQAQEADNIYRLQHPGDSDTSHLPYPDPSNPGGSGTASTWSGSGTSGITAKPIGLGTMDAAATGDNFNPQPVSQTYSDIASMPGYGDHAVKGLSPDEIATLIATNPIAARYYTPPTQADYADAASELKGIIAATQAGDWSKNPAGYAQQMGRYEKELSAVMSKLTANTATPYAYGKSIGMSDAALAAMGINPPDYGVTIVNK